jgi:type IV secretory pathway TraG/TraD family ATPase VirD4
MNAIITFFQSIIRTIAEFFHFGYELTLQSPRDPKLAAEFETDQQIISIYNEGFCVDGKRSLPSKEYKHAAIVGKSGIGKSSVCFVSSLLTMHGSGNSFIIHDCANELLPICAGHLKKNGYLVLKFNASNTKESIGYNPLENSKSGSDIDKLATLLGGTSTDSEGGFWNTSGQDVIKIAARLAVLLPKRY